MDLLEQLELAKGGPFTYRVNGQVRGLPSPSDLGYLDLLDLLAIGTFQSRFALPSMAAWQSDLLFGVWCAHFDLPDAQSARRLHYLVSKYARDLEFDLRTYAEANLGELWRSRQWRLLLNLIDHLPSHTYYSEAVSNDEEHAEMLAKAEAARVKSGDEAPAWAPPLRTWTPEVDALTKILDAINGLKYVTIAVNSEKGKAPPPPDPSPRPRTAIDGARVRAEYQRRMSKHKSIVARILPHKADSNALESAPPSTPPSPGTAFLRKKAGLTD